MPSDVLNDAPKPRLCHLIKWEDFNGFGFNLHAEKTKQGQFIGKVDEGSPAESAGLREGDRIIEVNGVNVSNENHKQVVERIKAIPNETKMLVVDPEAEKYYKNKKIVIKSTMTNVIYTKTAPSSGRRPLTPADNDSHSLGGSHHDNDDARSSSSDRESLHQQEADKLSRNGSNTSTPPVGRNGNGSTHSSVAGSPSTPPLTPTSAPLSRSVSSDSNGRTSSADLNLNMTASQMRALLATKKKYDPKKENLDLKKKHAIIQDM